MDQMKPCFWGLTTYKHIVDQIEFGGDELFSDEQAQINKEYPQSSYKISFSEKNGHTFILHQTKYNTAKQMEDSLGFGFEKGTVDAYARLDGFLLKV